MANGPVCGNDAQISVDGEVVAQCHKYTVNATANDGRVRVMGGGKFGAGLNCTSDGEIAIESYDYISGISTGSIVDISANVAGVVTFTANSASMISFDTDPDVDADVVNFNYNFRLNGDVPGL